MSWSIHSFWTIAIVVSICLKVTLSQRAQSAPVWKKEADALKNNYYRNRLQGSELKLSCPVKGSPKPLVEWFKYDELFVPQSSKIRVRAYAIKFLELEAEDRGNYTCVAQNSFGRVSFTYVVDVKEKIWPLQANVSSNLTVMEGETATFYCIVLNDNTARTQWLRIHNSRSRNAHEFLNSTSGNQQILIIKNVSVDDAGQYTCLLGNTWGSKYEHIYLTVKQLTTTTTSTTTTTTPTTTTTTSTTTSTTSTTTTTTPTTTTTTSTTQSTTTTPLTTTQAPFFPIDITTERVINKDRKKKKDKKKKKDRKDKKKNKKDKKRKKKKDKNKDRNREDNDNSVYKGYEVTQPPYNKYDDLYPYVRNENNVDPYGYDNDNFNTYTNMYEPQDPYQTDFTGDAIDPSLGYDPYGNPSNTNNLDEDGNQLYGAGATNGTNQDSKTTSSSGISVWTVYIIVGSVVGGILLISLVAIAIALCRQKEDDSQYKSTSV